jgi:hypothetical protein
VARRLLPERGLLVLLLLAALWYGWFVYRTSFTMDGRRIFCLFDDAMISMTYARNLVEGHGLAWARGGTPVEGFTHPLWTALMVPVNALPLPLRLRSLPVQILCLALLLVHLVLVRRLVRRHFSYDGARTWLPAAVLTAFYYPLVYWSLMGMETALQAVIATASVLLALDATRPASPTASAGAAEPTPAAAVRHPRHLALWLLAASAYLLRMDMLLTVAAVQVFLLAQGGVRRAERRRWLLGLAVFLAAVLGYELFRWLYFHDLLPNTYYLKLTGVPLMVRLLRGAYFLVEFARGHLLLLVAVALGTALLLLRGGGEERRRYALPAAIFLLQCAYSVWVGGDVWETDINVRANRFLAFAMPLVFVVGNGLLNRALAALPTLDAQGRRRDPAALLPAGLTLAATAAALLSADGLWRSEHAAENWQNLAVTARPLHVVSHEIVFTDLQHLRRLVAPGAAVASFWAGIPAYFSDYRMVDLLGYNDRRIARQASRVALDEDNYRLYQPGHAKWDTDDLLRVRRPDAFLQVWGMARPGRTLNRAGYRKVEGFWLRPGSDKLLVPLPPPRRPPPRTLANTALPPPGRGL